MIKKGFVLIFILGLFTVIAGYWAFAVDYAAQDEKNLRSLFHVPIEVVMKNFNDGPKESGWFGREGLYISGTFHFTDAQYAEYFAKTKDTSIWKPEIFLGRSPEIDEQFTEQSSAWRPLPIPALEEKDLDKWFIHDEFRIVQEGVYFCTISKMHHDKTPLYSKRYSCEEWQKITGSSKEPKYGFAKTLGVLNTKTKVLYVEYRM